MLMKKNHLFLCSKICVMALAGAGALFLASCAGDGFDNDESFIAGNGVRNTKLTTPTVDDITITASTDGSKQTISWPVVYGAGGYKAVLKNLSTDKILVDSVIDNLSFATNREEDTNYKLTLKVLGNTTLGNTEGEEVEKTFSTFTATYARIPAGNLNEYFEQNPIPDELTDELNFDLEAGQTYTLTGQLGFNYHKVCLRSSDKGNPATIEVGDNASFVISNNLSMKYLNIEVKAQAENARPLFELYKYETAPDGILEKPKNYYMVNAFNLLSCNIKGVVGSLIYDNNLPYCISGLTIKNCVIGMNTTTAKISHEAMLAFQGGGVKDFTITNSTVYQVGEGNSKYFLRYNNSVRADRITGSNTDFTTFTYTNNTFYKVVNMSDGQWFNCNGAENYSTYIARNNIWYDCTSGQIARRMRGNSRLGTNSTQTLLRNTYWVNGAPYEQGEFDTSGTILTTDPAFADPASGNFTPTGAEQVQYKTGDPRWFE